MDTGSDTLCPWKRKVVRIVVRNLPALAIWRPVGASSFRRVLSSVLPAARAATSKAPTNMSKIYLRAIRSPQPARPRPRTGSGASWCRALIIPLNGGYTSFPAGICSNGDIAVAMAAVTVRTAMHLVESVLSTCHERSSDQADCLAQTLHASTNMADHHGSGLSRAD